MLENNVPDAAKRYAPPQRNRVLSRRKSGDRFEKINYSHGNEPEKAQASYSRNFPAMDHGPVGNSYHQNEGSNPGLIPVDGCCNSEAAQLLTERWAAIMNSYNDPLVDLSDRPVMYSGASGSSLGHLKLPHQMDFLAELRRSMPNALGNTAAVVGEDS